jgi:hypothetical protein
MTLSGKIALLARECRYGLTHFCDGKPNLSEGDNPPKPPCPHGGDCPLKQHSVIRRKDESYIR